MKPVIGQVRPLQDYVLVHEMKFDRPVTKGGIILPRDDGKDSGIRPRWAQVYAIGPKQKDFNIGDWVLVAHGRWTRGAEVQADENSEVKVLRRVDINDILAVRDDAPDECDR